MDSPRDPDLGESLIRMGRLPRALVSCAGPDPRPLRPRGLRPWRSLLTGLGAHLPKCPIKLQVEQVPRDLAGASICLPCTHLTGREHRSWSCVNNSTDLLKPARPSKQGIRNPRLCPPRPKGLLPAEPLPCPGSSSHMAGLSRADSTGQVFSFLKTAPISGFFFLNEFHSSWECGLVVREPVYILFTL